MRRCKYSVYETLTPSINVANDGTNLFEFGVSPLSERI